MSCVCVERDIHCPLTLSSPCSASTVVAVPVVLGAVGFTSTGITASSLAAKMMSISAIANGGGVAAGSLVATLQSVGKCPLGGLLIGLRGRTGASVPLALTSAPASPSLPVPWYFLRGPSLSLGFSEADIGRREDALACSCSGIRLTPPKADFLGQLEHLCPSWGSAFFPGVGGSSQLLTSSLEFMPLSICLQQHSRKQRSLGGWGKRAGFRVGSLGLMPAPQACPPHSTHPLLLPQEQADSPCHPNSW